jgi:hypothetical protein
LKSLQFRAATSLIGRTFGGGPDSQLGDAPVNRFAFLNFGEDKIQELIVRAMLDTELAARPMTNTSAETVDGFIYATTFLRVSWFYAN